MVDDIRKKSAEVQCRIPLGSNSIRQDQIDWHFAPELKGVSHFSTSLSKVTNQFAVSTLYMNFGKNIAQEFEGKYGCKTDEFSNEVDLLINENARWSTWGDWSTCSMSCQLQSGKHGIRKRERSCMFESGYYIFYPIWHSN